MKSFKQYLNEAKSKVKQGVMVNGVPAAVILNDRETHIPVVPEVNQGIVVNGVPSAVVLNNRRKLKEDSGDRPTSWGFVNHNKHLGADEHDVEKSLHNTQQHSPKSLKHLQTYTEGSSTINKALYKHHVEGTTPESKIADPFVTAKEHDLHGLDKAAEHHTLGHDLHVYSGTHFNPGEVSAQHGEGHIHLPAFTSTSIDKETAAHFGHSASWTNPDLRKPVGSDPDPVHGHILHIHLKAGDKGAYLGQHSKFSSEKEFLLPRNTRLKVHPTPTMHHTSHNGHSYAVWHAETVKQD